MRQNYQRRIFIFALPGVQMLDVAGPLDVFAEANRQSGEALYHLSILGWKERTIETSSGIKIVADYLITEKEILPDFDDIFIAGAPYFSEAILYDETLLTDLRSIITFAKRYGSVCTGAILLGRAGLLNGRRITTHWAVEHFIKKLCPGISHIESDALYVCDGNLWSSAGVTAGLDLALALVENDYGVELAKKIASHLVMFFKRPGGQKQFSHSGEMTALTRSVLQDIQRDIIAHPDMETRLDILAARAGMSKRHFTRLFQAEIGMSPAVWIVTIRVEAARILLEQGIVPKIVAVSCGFYEVGRMRRAFRKILGITPAQYQKNFSLKDRT